MPYKIEADTFTTVICIGILYVIVKIIYIHIERTNERVTSLMNLNDSHWSTLEKQCETTMTKLNNRIKNLIRNVGSIETHLETLDTTLTGIVITECKVLNNTQTEMRSQFESGRLLGQLKTLKTQIDNTEAREKAWVNAKKTLETLR